MKGNSQKNLWNLLEFQSDVCLFALSRNMAQSLLYYITKSSPAGGESVHITWGRE